MLISRTDIPLASDQRETEIVVSGMRRKHKALCHWCIPFFTVENWADITLQLSHAIRDVNSDDATRAIDVAKGVVENQRVFFDKMDHVRGFLESMKDIGGAIKEVSEVDIRQSLEFMTIL